MQVMAHPPPSAEMSPAQNIPDSTQILPHSESNEEIEEDGQDQIERIWEDGAGDEPEVLAGLAELSHLCEQSGITSVGNLQLNQMNVGPAKSDENNPDDVDFPDDANPTPDFNGVTIGKHPPAMDPSRLIDPSVLVYSFMNALLPNISLLAQDVNDNDGDEF